MDINKDLFTMFCLFNDLMGLYVFWNSIGFDQKIKLIFQEIF